MAWKKYIPQILFGHFEILGIHVKFQRCFWIFGTLQKLWDMHAFFRIQKRTNNQAVVCHQGHAGKSREHLEVCPPQQQFGPTVMDHLTVGYIDVFLLCLQVLHLGWWRQGATGLVIVIYHLQLGISALYCRLLVPGSETGPRSDERMVIKSTLVDPFSTFSIIFWVCLTKPQGVVKFGIWDPELPTKSARCHCSVCGGICPSGGAVVRSCGCWQCLGRLC